MRLETRVKCDQSVVIAAMVQRAQRNSVVRTISTLGVPGWKDVSAVEEL